MTENEFNDIIVELVGLSKFHSFDPNDKNPEYTNVGNFLVKLGDVEKILKKFINNEIVADSIIKYEKLEKL